MKVYLINILILVLGFYLYNKPETASLFPSFISNAFIKEKTVVVIGGGLAGLSAAVEAHNQGHTKVILIEKEKNIGGNSMKATSGINAIEPLNKDTRELFIQDTLQSGGGRSREDLVFKLVDESQDAIRWLIKESEEEGQPTLDLSLTSRCGGHSISRTHRCPPQEGRPVGWKLIDTLKKRFLSFDHGAQVMTQTRVLNLLTDQQKNIKGIMLTRTNPETGKQTMEILQADAVVLTSGGFAGQTGHYLSDGQHTLLSEYAPQLIDHATTNGPWASGDGVRLATTIGAMTTDMEQVQVHPTGFVDPTNPTSPTKFLAPEALRAYGAILLNGQGKRFVDELTLRDQVTTAINAQTETTRPAEGWMSKTVSENYAAAYMVLPDMAVEGFGTSTLGFYASKGLFTKVEGVEGLAQLLDADVETLEREFKEYDEFISRREEKADKTGKTFFPSALLPSKYYHVALITPVVHYTMGGLEINTDAAIMKQGGGVISGLYGAGEVTGGVHGKNRLAGNSLLECVVFGRTAGRNAALFARQKK